MNIKQHQHGLKCSDFIDGARLICISSGHPCYTVGSVYTVIQGMDVLNVTILSCDDDDMCVFTIEELRGLIDANYPAFLPIANLDSKEEFTYMLSGKIPGRFL